ncbi:glycosyl-transferase for dystroglycan-domain-containing protein [Collybia nuda]|uniref:Glycosyl-transferase for dystroglycan-domain-containing protein n=1 Tax=Collybia nuda TaxID=64659 RepID=A0A9P5XTW1_9AGAR|nr:glycosyl-transferase for dystroglycan-domain-containing protein [Collybia nuda]
MRFLNRSLRTVQLFTFLYVIVAVLYASHFFLISPLCTGLSFLFNHSLLPWYIWTPSLTDVSPSIQSSVVEWKSLEISLEYNLGYSQPFLIDGGLFLSKTLSCSMQPSRTIPYFYRANGTFDPDDITIATLITSNRFQVFRRLVERYQGPISVTIHVHNSPTHMQNLLESLHTLYTSSETMTTYVDVHLVIDSFDRQFNTWRNISRLFARTNFVLMLDIDFYICTDFRAAMRRSKSVMNKLREGAAFVIPAFEYVNYAAGVDQSAFPQDKQELLALVKSKRIRMFHASWGPGHNSTDYKKYYTASTGDIYKVTQYQSAYEPYVVFLKEGPPWCNERFIGYGGNKAACLFEMYLSGVSFYVLADHFIVHQNHLYEENVRKNERRYNRKVYLEFKEEMCLRYLKKYHTSGLPNGAQGLNAYHECKGIKNVERLTAEVSPPSPSDAASSSEYQILKS